MTPELISYYYNLFSAGNEGYYRSPDSDSVFFPVAHAAVYRGSELINMANQIAMPLNELTKAIFKNKNKVPNLNKFLFGVKPVSTTPRFPHGLIHGTGDSHGVKSIIGKIAGINFSRLPNDEHLATIARFMRNPSSSSEATKRSVDALNALYKDISSAEASISLDDPCDMATLLQLSVNMSRLNDETYLRNTSRTAKSSSIYMAVFLYDTLRIIMGGSDNTRLMAMVRGVDPIDFLLDPAIANIAVQDWHTYMALVCYYRLVNNDIVMADLHPQRFQGQAFSHYHPMFHLAFEMLSGRIPVDERFHCFFKFCTAVGISGSTAASTGYSHSDKENISYIIRDAVTLMGMENGVLEGKTHYDILASLFGPLIVKYYYGVRTLSYGPVGRSSVFATDENIEGSIRYLANIEELNLNDRVAVAHFTATNRTFANIFRYYESTNPTYWATDYAFMYKDVVVDRNPNTTISDRNYYNTHLNVLLNSGPHNAHNRARMSMNQHYRMQWEQCLAGLREHRQRVSLPANVEDTALAYYGYLYLIGSEDRETLPTTLQQDSMFGWDGGHIQNYNRRCYQVGIADTPFFDMVMLRVRPMARTDDIANKMILLSTYNNGKALVNCMRHIASVSEMQQFIFGRTSIDIQSIMEALNLDENSVKSLCSAGSTKGFGSTLLSYAIRRATVNS